MMNELTGFLMFLIIMHFFGLLICEYAIKKQGGLDENNKTNN